MFPFSYNNKIELIIENNAPIDLAIILNKFKKQFDNLILKNQNTITFDNFNIAFKRHRWLDGGVINISLKDNRVFTGLTLNFFTTPIILLLISGFLAIWNIDELWIALFGVAVFWTFYLLLFIWTVTMFKMTIKRTIHHELFLAQTGLNEKQNVIFVIDKCPACGNKIKISDVICLDCGLEFEYK